MGTEAFISTIETGMSLLAEKLGGTLKTTSDKEELHFGNSPLYLWRPLVSDTNRKIYNYAAYLANDLTQTTTTFVNIQNTLYTYTNETHTVRAIGTSQNYNMIIAKDTNNGLTALFYSSSNIGWFVDDNSNPNMTATFKGQTLTYYATSIFKCPNIITGYMFKDLYCIFSAPTNGGGTKFSMDGKKYMSLGSTLPFAVEVE